MSLLEIMGGNLQILAAIGLFKILLRWILGIFNFQVQCKRRHKHM